MDEAVFMSQFLPRSLNQVADVDIKQMEMGEVEDSYAEAAAVLTGNQEQKQRKIALEGGHNLLEIEDEVHAIEERR